MVVGLSSIERLSDCRMDLRTAAKTRGVRAMENDESRLIYPIAHVLRVVARAASRLEKFNRQAR